MKNIALSRINELFARIAATYTLYAPIQSDDAVRLTQWGDGDAVRLDALQTVNSGKDCFLPQTENLVAFHTRGQSIDVLDVRQRIQDFVLFGVRACDVQAFEILDKVYLSEPVDSYYKARRDASTVVAMGCGEPAETCFCNALGIDARNPAADVATWMVGDTLYWHSITDKGAVLTEKLSDILQETRDTQPLDAYKRAAAETIQRLPHGKVSLDGFGGDATHALFDAPQWGELSQSCLGCGSCTYVCPTCQCYDITDFKNGDCVTRTRCWDSCMYADFTKMAHGNPRTSQKERFRQRFMHKLVYYPANHDGLYSCVGCGRCLQRCPVSLNIVKVIKALGGGRHV